MANPIILHDNRLFEGTITATDTASGYNVANIIDHRPYTFWQAASAGLKYLTVDLQKVLNPGFESNFTNWTQNNTTLETTIVHSGAKSGKLVAAGANTLGAQTDPIVIDQTKNYKISVWNKITVHTTGDYRVTVYFYDDEAGTQQISTYDLFTSSGVIDWTEITGNIVPLGGAGIIFPRGTKSLRVGHRWWNASGNPSGTAYMDDLQLMRWQPVDALGIVGHNLFSSYAAIWVDSSDDGAAWTNRLVSFYADSDKALLKTFNAATARYWRIALNTYNIAPRIGVAVLGEKIQFEYPPDSPYRPYEESIAADTSRGKTGNLLGSVIHYKRLDLYARFSNFSRSWVEGTFKAFWDNHASDMKPFFYAWDLTNYADYVFFVGVKDGAKYAAPVSILSRIDEIELEMTGVKE